MSSPASEVEDGVVPRPRLTRVRVGQVFPRPIIPSDVPLASLRPEVTKETGPSHPLPSRAVSLLGVLLLAFFYFYFTSDSALEAGPAPAPLAPSRDLGSGTLHAAGTAAPAAAAASDLSPAAAAPAAGAAAGSEDSAAAEEGGAAQEGKLRGKRSGPPVAAAQPPPAPAEDAAAATARLKALEEEARKKVESDKVVHASEAKRAIEDMEKEERERERAKAALEDKAREAKEALEGAAKGKAEADAPAAAAPAAGTAAAAAGPKTAQEAAEGASAEGEGEGEDEEGEGDGEGDEAVADDEVDEGPLVVQRALRGKCFQHVGKDVNGHKNTYSFCPYKSVEQHVVDEGVTFKVGVYQGWLPADEESSSSSGSAEGGGSGAGEGGAKAAAAAAAASAPLYSAHLYSGGDSCGATINRATVVVFHCDSTMTTPTLIKAAEVEVCTYRLDMALKAWCSVEEKGQAVKYEGK